MKFSALTHLISEKFPLISTRILEDTEVFCVSLLSGAMEVEEGVLYFTDDLSAVNVEGLHGNFVWYGEMTESLQTLSANWMQVRGEDFLAVKKEVEGILLNEYKTQNLRLRMLDIVMSGRGLTALVDEAAKSLNTTIVVIDMSGKIISRSTPFMIDDPLWVESIKQGFCPPFFIEHLRDMRTKVPVGQEKQTILRHCADTNIYYLAKRIYIYGELYGYVFLLQMHNRFSPFSEEVLNILAQTVINQNLKARNAENVKSPFYNNLVIDIFQGISSEQINARIYAGEMKFPRRMCLAAIKPKYFQGENYVREKLSGIVEQTFPKNIQVYYHKMMVIIADLSTGLPGAYEEFIDKLRGIAAQEQVIIGVSNSFTKVTSMKHYYVQAVRAIEISQILDLPGEIHFYKDIALYDLLKNDSTHNNIGFYCHPALSILREYDSENGSMLHDTLRSLAENGFNNNATAQEMFLHRNTLAYRKQKIVSLTGLDLDDFDNQFMLRYSFMIERFMDKHVLLNASSL